MKDGSIFVASLDLRKDGLKSVNTEEEETMQDFFLFFFTELNKKQKGADEMNKHCLPL